MILANWCLLFLGLKGTSDVALILHADDTLHGRLLSGRVREIIVAMHSNRAISVTIIDSSVGHVLTTLPAENVFELGFSPLGTFVITWQRPSKDENGDATKNLKVWRVIEGAQEGAGEGAIEDSVVGRFVQKSQTGWNLQYTSDERYCARVVTNEVQFYKSDDLSTVWNKLCVEGVSDFALSPGKSHSIAVFVPERKVRVSDLIIFLFPSPAFTSLSFSSSSPLLPSLMAFTDATYYSTEPTGSSQDVCHPSVQRASFSENFL